MTGRLLTADERAAIAARVPTNAHQRRLDVAALLAHADAADDALTACRLARDAEQDAADAKIAELENLVRILGEQVVRLEREAADA